MISEGSHGAPDNLVQFPKRDPGMWWFLPTACITIAIALLVGVLIYG